MLAIRAVLSRSCSESDSTANNNNNRTEKKKKKIS